MACGSLLGSVLVPSDANGGAAAGILGVLPSCEIEPCGVAPLDPVPGPVDLESGALAPRSCVAIVVALVAARTCCELPPVRCAAVSAALLETGASGKAPAALLLAAGCALLLGAAPLLMPLVDAPAAVAWHSVCTLARPLGGAGAALPVAGSRLLVSEPESEECAS